MVTTLVLFSLFTVHWKKTASALITENKIFFTEGLFLLCRQAKTSWLPQKDVYCSSANDEFNRWLIAGIQNYHFIFICYIIILILLLYLSQVQFFYTLGSFLNVLTFIAAFIGLFKDVKTKKQAFSSFLFWTLSTACLCQLIAISIYGRYSIGDYTYYEPDYSIIIASVALGINALCVLLFFVDICKSRTTKRY